MPYLSGYWVWGRIRICPRRAVSDSAFCAGVECTDQRKNLLGNPSEAEKFPEPPPYVPTRMPYEGPHMLRQDGFVSCSVSALQTVYRLLEGGLFRSGRYIPYEPLLLKI